MATDSAASRPLVPGRIVRPLAWSATAERTGLLLLLVGSAALFLWNLGASGWANPYYSAAALAGSKDWMAFLFGSFDAGNAITVDKTPASLWVMSLSVRLFGFSSWSILVPQALEGVAAVWLLYLTVRRRAGPIGGLVAGAILALTPVATLMFRFNNPDALLTLLLVAAAYATLRGTETASTRWLVVAAAAVGFAFLAKMLQGFLIIPALTSVYLVAAPAPFRRRLWQVGVAAVTVVASAGWWLLLVVLWPAGARPYIGGSQTNSIIDLMLGYNGLGRITGDEVGRVGGGGGGFGAFGAGGFGAGPFSGDAGWFRLFGGELGSTVSWLLPVALVSLLGILWLTRRRPRTDALRAQALLWGGWLVVTGLVFSLMEGIFHPYYTVALVPAIGGLVGMGLGLAWAHRDEPLLRAVAVGAVALSTFWAVTLLARSPGWIPWLSPMIVAVASVAALGVLYLHHLPRAAARATLALLVAALVAAPASGSIATAAEPHSGAIPTTEPAVRGGGLGGGLGGGFGGRGGGFGNGVFGRGRIGQLPAPNGFGVAPGRVPSFTVPFGGFGGGRGTNGNGGSSQIGPNGPNGASGPSRASRGGTLGGLLDAAQPNAALVAALQNDAAQYRWVAATTGSNNAAGLALSSEQSVMAIGGFNGTDPTPTLEQFQAYVAAGEIHYYIAGNDAAGFRGAQGGSRVSAAIAQWVADTFTPTTVGGVTVYDLTGRTR
jgi:4-amino-4-deoxy-L-arabinose transferase-like glycosyltransferase